MERDKPGSQCLGWACNLLWCCCSSLQSEALHTVLGLLSL